MMRQLQRLGKALMLPVATLPLCGLLMGIGYVLCPTAMQGGDVSGAVSLVGLFLVKAGGALIDNMAILFALGVGVGLSEDNDGTGGLAALVSWLMIIALLSPDFVQTIIPSVANDANALLAFQRTANPFVGILAGIIGSTSYNRFHATKTPEWLAFFSGKRCVAIVAYAALYGVFTVVTVALGFRAGFAFSAGATDLVFSAPLPAAQGTLLIIPLGIAAFVVFYLVFRGMIKALDLKTPGREDEDVLPERAKPEPVAAKPEAIAEDDEFTAMARGVLAAVGGPDNVERVDSCATRLRLEVRDDSLVDEVACKAAGARGVFKLGCGSVQVVIGMQVQHVADAFKRLLC